MSTQVLKLEEWGLGRRGEGFSRMLNGGRVSEGQTGNSLWLLVATIANDIGVDA